nr:phospholipase-like protein [Tanacetum cinerariifolium]
MYTPRASPVEYGGLFGAYLKKLSLARTCREKDEDAESGCQTSTKEVSLKDRVKAMEGLCTSLMILPKEIKSLKARVYKLETIIDVITKKRVKSEAQVILVTSIRVIKMIFFSFNMSPNQSANKDPVNELVDALDDLVDEDKCDGRVRTMATTIDQQVALDEALVPSTKRLRIGRSNFRLPSDIQSKESTLQVVYDVLRRCPFLQAFLVTADVPEIYMQEFWATAIVYHHSIRFKMNNKKHIINLELFRDMFHVCPRVPGQSFDELPFEAEILEFLRNQDTQQYRAILPIELTNEDIRNTTAYKEYYAYATGVAAPKPKASASKKRGDSDTSLTPPIATTTPITTAAPVPRLSAAAKGGKRPARATTHTEPTDVKRTEAEQLKIVLRRSRQETHMSQQRGFGTDEGTVSRPGVPDVPSDDSEQELSWNSSDDEGVDAQDKGDKNDESDDGSDDGNDDYDVNDDEEELAKNDDKDKESGKGGDEVSESKGESNEEETRQEEEESFDLIPRTPEGSEDEGNDKEDQDLRISEEARIQEEEEADELYRDVDINQGRGLQLSQNIEDSHVTLTPVHPDGLQESSSMSSFVTSMLNPISGAEVESIFTTTSSPIVSLQTPTPIMTPSTIATITTSSDAPIPPTTIPSTILENLPTFNSVFRFDERLRSLETTFSEYRQTNSFVDVVSTISGNKSIQRSNEQRNLYKALVEAYDADKTILDTYGESTILNQRREDDDQEGPSVGSDRGSKIRREGGEHASASTPSETTTRSAGRSTTGSQSRQLSASESAFVEEPVQTTYQIEELSHPPRRPPSPDRDWNKTLPTAQGDGQSWISKLAMQTDARSSFNELLDTPIDFSNFIMNRLNVDTLTPALLAGPTYELMRGSCNSLTELEYHLEEVYKATTDQLDWVNPEGQQYPHNQLQPLPLIPDNRGRRRRIIAVTELKIVKWHNYKHLDWISVRHDDDKIYIFKEGDFKRLCLQDIEDMLLLLEHCHPKASERSLTGNKTILDTYGESTILKRRREDNDKEGASARSDRGSKRRRERGEHALASTPSKTATGSAGRSTTWSQSRQLSTSESAFAEEPVQTTCQMEEPSHLVFETGTDDQPIVQTSQHPEWFSQPRRPPSPDRDWNKTLPAAQGDAQSWISELARQTDARSSFNELLDTPIDFSNFIMNRLGVATLTPELLAGPTYKLMRGSCNSLTELEYHLEEVYKATTDQLDWVNPEGQQYPHNLLQPLPLIPDNRGRRVIPFDHFINNDLEYLRGGDSSRKYTNSVTKTKAADYGYIKWIEDLVPRAMWIQEPINYDRHALWGVSHWGWKRQQFYRFAVNR